MGLMVNLYHRGTADRDCDGSINLIGYKRAAPNPAAILEPTL